MEALSSARRLQVRHARANVAPTLTGVLPTEYQPPWTLADFPPNYVLSRRTQIRGPEHDHPGTARVDIYLYGMSLILRLCRLPHTPSPGGNSRFASPAEFAPHAIWLMHGAEARMCACKYCAKTPQKTITSVMDAAVENAIMSRPKVYSGPPLKALPSKSPAPPAPVADDAEFLRALKRKRSDTHEPLHPPATTKEEQDELANDVL